ncbi:MAG: hypothetical protein ACLR2E_13530 [Lachnospiraceae bacterium]
MEEKQIEMKRAHRLTMEGRRCAAITGVSDVLSFDVEKWCSRPRTAF